MMTDILIFGVQLSLKATLLLAAAFGLACLLRRRAAAERHLLWVVATCGVLALPLFAFMLPTWRLPVDLGAWPTKAPAVVTAQSVGGSPAADRGAALEAQVTPRPSVTVESPAGPRSAGVVEAMSTGDPDAAGGTPLMSRTVIERPAPATRGRLHAGAVVVLVWLAGALAAAGVLLLSFARVRAVAARTRPLADENLLRLARNVMSELRVRRHVRFLEGDDDAMPMTFGVIHSSVLLPSSAADWPAGRQQAVLRHELAHIARRDAWTQLAAELACVLHWYNPLVWLAARRLCVEREHACDDAVLTAGCQPAEYAAELVEIARTMRARRGTAVAAIAMARASQLRTRTIALLDGRRRSGRLSHRLLVPAWAGAFALVTTLASVAPDHARPALPQTPAAPRPASFNSALAGSPAPAPDASIGTGPGASFSIAPPALIATGPGAWFSIAPPAPAAGVGAAGVEAPPVPFEARAAAGTWSNDCLGDGRARNVISNNNSNGRRSFTWSGDDCSGEVLVDGDVQFDAAFTTITGISRGGEVRLDVTERGERRRLNIRPSGSGLTYDYQHNGDRREFDAAAQRWLDEQLLSLFRRFGFMAEQRAQSILARGGATGLLAEVELLQSDHVRAKYLAVAVGAGQLDEASLRRVLALAGSSLSSDHYRTSVITAVAGKYEFTDGVRTAYIDAVSGMRSDHYRHRAFSTLLQEGRLTPAQVSAVLNETERIGSDHYRAELLGELSDAYRTTPAVRPAFMRAAGGLGSDHYKHRVLSGLLATGNLTPADERGVVEAGATIGSDHYRARLLSGVVSRRNLDAATLAAVLDAARTIKSDHYKSELLVEIATTHDLEGPTRDLLLDVMNGIRSSTYRGRVAETMLRRSR